MNYIVTAMVVVSVSSLFTSADEYTPDDSFFISIEKSIYVNDLNFGARVYKLNAKRQDPDGETNDYDRGAFFLSYGGQLSILQVPGKVIKYYVNDINGDSGEEFIVEYIDRGGIYHLKSFSSGAGNGENRDNVDMYSLNKVDVKSSEKDGFVIDAASGVINAKVKDKSGNVVNHVYKISESFDFKIKPVLLLHERLK